MKQRMNFFNISTSIEQKYQSNLVIVAVRLCFLLFFVF